MFKFRSRSTRYVLAGPLACTMVAALAVAPATTSATASDPPGNAASRPGDLEISTLSGRPDTVTGGDTLVRVDVPRSVPLHRVTVTADDADVTDAFVADKSARTLTGLVADLPDGESTIEARGPGQVSEPAQLSVTNHPRTGPVFSGPHQQPFACETEKFNVPVIGGNLGAPLDENCSIEPRVDYFY
ncbi:DUF6351 family protein, partial [Phytoactinopolyspora endophytica]|uniref:DUF6351 family protein n=1 Tax=Phytoactinopolyspora endophytica TaxID=1642495 RepID=UPI00197B3348